MHIATSGNMLVPSVDRDGRADGSSRTTQLCRSASVAGDETPIPWTVRAEVGKGDDMVAQREERVAAEERGWTDPSNYPWTDGHMPSHVVDRKSLYRFHRYLHLALSHSAL